MLTMNKKFKSVIVESLKSRDVYYGPDGIAVWNAIHDANMNGMDTTLPIHLDDSQEEIIIGMNQLVNVRKTFKLDDDE